MKTASPSIDPVTARAFGALGQTSLLAGFLVAAARQDGLIEVVGASIGAAAFLLGGVWFIAPILKRAYPEPLSTWRQRLRCLLFLAAAFTASMAYAASLHIAIPYAAAV